MGDSPGCWPSLFERSEGANGQVDCTSPACTLTAGVDAGCSRSKSHRLRRCRKQFDDGNNHQLADPVCRTFSLPTNREAFSIAPFLAIAHDDASQALLVIITATLEPNPLSATILRRLLQTLRTTLHQTFPVSPSCTDRNPSLQARFYVTHMTT